jgi:hypothetical protein
VVRKTKSKITGAAHVSVILPLEVTEKIDACARDLENKSPGAKFTRSDVVRLAIYEFLKKLKMTPPPVTSVKAARG